MKKLVSLLLLLAALMLAVSPALAHDIVYFGYLDGSEVSWLVLDSNSRYTTLLSQYAVLCRPFSTKESNSWRNSSLRKYLNNTLLYEMFSGEEINALSYVDKDLIRIPSLNDMTNPNYGFSSNRAAEDPARRCYGGYGRHTNGLWTNAQGQCSYFTLTPSNSGDNLYQIRTDGSTGVAKAGRDNVGVRLMITVSTAELDY